LRAATVEGLVGFDAEGRVVPGLADRWIVTDDGQSYIFRLRDGTWPDGARIDAEDVAASLRRALAALRGSPLGLDLASIDEIRVMTDRVIEVDLQSPLPDLLTLLAQPNSAFPMRDRAAALWRCSAPAGRGAVAYPARQARAAGAGGFRPPRSLRDRRSGARRRRWPASTTAISTFCWAVGSIPCRWPASADWSAATCRWTPSAACSD
jgi:hypothetical protein